MSMSLITSYFMLCSLPIRHPRALLIVCWLPWPTCVIKTWCRHPFSCQPPPTPTCAPCPPTSHPPLPGQHEIPSGSSNGSTEHSDQCNKCKELCYDYIECDFLLCDWLNMYQLTSRGINDTVFESCWDDQSQQTEWQRCSFLHLLFKPKYYLRIVG